jgi:hypothetical protein
MMTPDTVVPDDPSIKWMLGTLIVILGALLAYVVKAVVDRIGPGQEKVVDGLKDLVAAVKENTGVLKDLNETARDRDRARV